MSGQDTWMKEKCESCKFAKFDEYHGIDMAHCFKTSNVRQVTFFRLIPESLGKFEDTLSWQSACAEWQAKTNTPT